MEEKERQERASVVAEALTWEKTPFKWEGALKGVGVDCGRFLAGVFNNAGLRQIDFDKLPHISPQWFLHKSDESFLNVIRMFAGEEKQWTGQILQPGDIVVAECGRDYAHSAIVVKWPTIVGAAMGHVVTRWRDIHTSPQYNCRRLVYFNPWSV